MAYTSWSLVYGEQPSTAKWNILGTNDSHFDSFLGSTLAWQSWTPTLANITQGNGTLKCYYTQVGKIVFCRFYFLLGNTSAIGTGPTFTVPVAANTRYDVQCVGHIMLEDASAGSNTGVLGFNTSQTVMLISAMNAAGSYAIRQGITSTVPFTWTTSDYLAANFSYEAA